MWSVLRCRLNRIQIPFLRKNTCIRHYMKTSERMELLLKQADYVPFNYKLVYRYKGHKMGGFMYHSVSFITCVSVTAAAYHVYLNGIKDKANVIDYLKTFENPLEIIIVSIFTVGMVILASAIRSRYVIRIYYNNKNKMFKAIFTGKIPFTIEHYDFPTASMTRVAKNSLLPWKNSLFNANGRNILLFEDYFKTHGDLYTMLRPEELKNVDS